MKLSKKKNILIILASCCVLGLGLLTFFSLRKAAIGDVLSEKAGMTLENEILGASSLGMSQISVNETGIFFINSEAQLSYYDYETQEKYVLCNAPQCAHNNAECNAYMGEMERYGGYAFYGDAIYVLYKAWDSEYLELVSMDTAGQNKKTVSRIYAGDNTLKEWRLGMIGEVYYYDGYAYIKLEYDKKAETSEETQETVQGEQLLAVNLSDGQIKELTEILVHGQDVTGIDWSLFADGQAVYAVRYFDEKIPTEEAYYQENPEGNYDEYYISFWKEVSKTLEYQMFDSATGEITTIASGKIRNQDMGMAGYSEQDPFYFEGAYEGKWLAMDYTDEETMYYWFDKDTGQMTEFVRIARGQEADLLGWFYGEATSLIYEGNKLLGEENLEDEKEQIFYLDLETGERHDLAVYNANGWGKNSVLLVEETSKYIIGRGNGSDIYYIVDKEDFEESYFQKSKEITF